MKTSGVSREKPSRIASFGSNQKISPSANADPAARIAHFLIALAGIAISGPKMQARNHVRDQPERPDDQSRQEGEDRGFR